MSDDNLAHGLAAIAEQGHRTGRLEAASALRARGDRRRRRRYAATGAFSVVLAGALGVGIAVARPQAQAPLPPVASASDPALPSAPPSVTPSAAPSVSASVSKTPSRPPSSPSRPASSGGVLSGDRQVFLYPIYDGATVPDSIAAVTSAGRLDITADFGDRALLVPVPKSPGSKQFLFKTGKLRSGGEALCLQVQGNGSNPLTLVTKACDAGVQDQTFKFEENGRDNSDRMTYLISVGGVYMHYAPYGTPGTGLIVQESGEGDDLTSFVLIDRGKATIPRD